MAAELFLTVNGYDLEAADDDLVQVTVAVASGDITLEALAIWVRQRTLASEA